VRDVVTDSAGRMVKANQRGNFRRANSLSYAYSSPFSNALEYRMDENRVFESAIMADKGPRPNVDDETGAVLGPAFDAPTLELSGANSPNHGRAGQNVLHGGGWVFFERTPYSGAGRVLDKDTMQVVTPGDNIYTALAPKPLAADQRLPANANGYWGRHIGPAWKDDSYLVPTVGEEPGETPPATMPTTTPAATTTAATVPLPATQPATAPAYQPPTGTP
jgi:hypothetical protein